MTRATMRPGVRLPAQCRAHRTDAGTVGDPRRRGRCPDRRGCLPVAARLDLAVAAEAGETRRAAHQWVVSAPSSPVMFANGLNTNDRPSVDPPHSTPSSFTLVPLVTLNTSEPLSPPPTFAFTMV